MRRHIGLVGTAAYCGCVGHHKKTQSTDAARQDRPLARPENTEQIQKRQAQSGMSAFDQSAQRWISTRAEFCPLLAQNGHGLVHCKCPLLGVKRTCIGHRAMSAFDPKRTRRLHRAEYPLVTQMTWGHSRSQRGKSCCESRPGGGESGRTGSWGAA